MVRWLPIIVLGLALVVGILLMQASHEASTEAYTAPIDAPLSRAQSVPASAKRDPTMIATAANQPDDEISFDHTTKQQRVDRELAAMRAVYGFCEDDRWEDGSTLTAYYVDGSKGPRMINVSVDVPDKEHRADGNTLWYRVTLDKKGWPKSLRANKHVSAQLCSGTMGAEEVEYDLPPTD